MGLVAQIKIAMVLVALATGGLGFAYVKKLQSDLETARANVIQMEMAVKISEESLQRQQEETARLNELNGTLQADLQKAEKYGDELRATLQKHNLTYLAERKPSLTQEKMQNATDKLWDDLFSITNPNVVQQTGTSDTDGNTN